jgi:hypothetical protein
MNFNHQTGDWFSAQSALQLSSVLEENPLLEYYSEAKRQTIAHRWENRSLSELALGSFCAFSISIEFQGKKGDRGTTVDFKDSEGSISASLMRTSKKCATEGPQAC